MKTIELQVKRREDTGKKAARKLRKQGYVPCVVYGGETPIHCYAKESTFKDIVYTPEVFLITLDIDGEKVKAIKKDVQFHPVKDNILHVDFLKVTEDKPVKLYMPVKLVGFAKGVQAGGQLYQLMRYIKVKGHIQDIPERLEVDITDLGLGKSLKISDLKYDKLEVLEPASAVVALVKLTRAALSRLEAEKQAQK